MIAPAIRPGYHPGRPSPAPSTPNPDEPKTRVARARALAWPAVVLGTPSTPAANAWAKTDAVIEGRRWDVPVGYDPASKWFLVLGGRTFRADSRKPRSYDVLGFDPAGKWRNELPAGTAPARVPGFAPGGGSVMLRAKGATDDRSGVAGVR